MTFDLDIKRGHLGALEGCVKKLLPKLLCVNYIVFEVVSEDPVICKTKNKTNEKMHNILDYETHYLTIYIIVLFHLLTDPHIPK